MKTRKQHLLIIWTIFILILTLVPTPEYNGTVETYYDKIAHIFMFGIFSYLFFVSQKRIDPFPRFFLAISLGLGFSLLIEFLQMYVPSRDANHWDFYAGALGVITFSIYAFARK